MLKIDQIDCRILEELQRDAAQSQRELADSIGLSQNACWRRLKALEAAGAIRNHTVLLNREKLGAGLVVIMMVRTRHHSSGWLGTFRDHVSSIPNVVDFYRIGGDYDYLIKVVTRDMTSYDAIYQRLISEVELENVTSYFAMEAIAEQRPFPVHRADED
ncbi:Lrp/AsnC family transcriptional regulator [Labrenzia sp. OB1]|uniref:Lrp/AsnC family transcriptional regulator n=1 Tax=Labrenzia sp. OB1 TaxID=1561204 RepID=UPI0007B2B056|nr:Lrp/AsnC family transcriptional regulator [Labrenzia sp. OB1]KZM50633.1 transcriptional regulator [Labrenzia sp. OB1]